MAWQAYPGNGSSGGTHLKQVPKSLQPASRIITHYPFAQLPDGFHKQSDDVEIETETVIDPQ